MVFKFLKKIINKSATFRVQKGKTAKNGKEVPFFKQYFQKLGLYLISWGSSILHRSLLRSSSQADPAKKASSRAILEDRIEDRPPLCVAS